MSPELFVLLLENLREFFGREDVQEQLGDFFWGDDTELHLARSLEATYNAMSYSAEVEEIKGQGADCR